MHYAIGRIIVPLVLLVGAAHAGTVRIGALEVPADCALARNEHPRLLFRGRDLPAYRERIRGPMKAEFARFRGYWDRKIAAAKYGWSSTEQMDGIALGVLYRLTGERRYADVIRKSPAFRGGSKYWSHAFTLDLIFDTLSKDELKAQAVNFLRGAQTKFRWGTATYCLWPAIALYGAGTGRDAEIADWLVRGVRGVERDLADVNHWADSRGGDVNSFSYIGNHTLIRLSAHVMAMTNALGRDYWTACAWTRHIASYYVYHFMPWRHSAIHFDNTTGLQFGPGTRSGDFGGTYLLHAAPARYRDGLYQWWIERMLVHQNPNLRGWPRESRRRHVMAGLWGRILFYEPALPALGPEHLPPSRFFRTRGFASMRESWEKDATFVHFRCGAFGGLGDGRHNADNNTFTIYKKGILALDTGGAHSLDMRRLKFNPPDDGPNFAYSSHTIAHNGILVHHEIDKPNGKLTNHTGGQALRRWPREWNKMRGVKLTGDNMGRILAWETSPEYDYVCGDATHAYSPATVKSFTRQLVYVRPNLIFLYDRVETARDGCRTTWLLHTADKPTIDGVESPDTRIHPDGHFLWKGSTVAVTDQEMGGRMFCKMLLPARREVRLLGGANHEFELPDGSNPGPTPESYKLPKESSAVRLSRALGEGLRGWRVEVEDRTGRRAVRFLHVFQTGDRKSVKMAPCTRVTRAGLVGAKIEIGGRKIEVLFRDHGPVGGQITIEKGRRKILNKALAGKIEDHYRKWKSDPRYRTWMTDPHLKSVIGEKEVAAYRMGTMRRHKLTRAASGPWR